MAYQKQTWRDFDDTKTDLQNINNGAVVTPERLNHIENGIANSADKAEVTAQLQQTEQELNAQLAQNTQELIKTKADVSGVGHDLATTNERIDTIVSTPAGTISEQEIIDARQGEASLNANLTKIKTNLNTIQSAKNSLLNGNFATTQYFPQNNATFTVNNYEGALSPTAQGGKISQAVNTLDGHRYYIKADVLADSHFVELVSFNGTGDVVVKPNVTGDWETLSHVVTVNGTGLKNLFQFRDNRPSGWTTSLIKNAMIVDVTNLFENTQPLHYLDRVFADWFENEKVLVHDIQNISLDRITTLENQTLTNNWFIEKNVRMGTWAFVTTQPIYSGSSNNRLRSLNALSLEPNTTYVIDIDLADNLSIIFGHILPDGSTAYESGWFKWTYRFKTSSAPERLHFIIKHDTDRDMTLDDINKITLKMEKQTNIHKPFFADRPKVHYFAHRGAIEFAPENTIPAVTKAKEYGFDGVEFDVGFTSDGVAVCLHDETVDRTTDGTGNYSSMTYADIQALTIDYGNGLSEFPNLKVPTLREMLTECKKQGLLAIIHFNRMNSISECDLFVNILNEMGLTDKVLVLPPNNPGAQRIRELDKSIYMTYQVTSNDDTGLRAAYRYDNTGLAIDMTLNPDYTTFIDNAHKMGMLVSTFIINEGYVADNLISQGVDFITTDTIDILP